MREGNHWTLQLELVQNIPDIDVFEHFDFSSSNWAANRAPSS